MSSWIRTLGVLAMVGCLGATSNGAFIAATPQSAVQACPGEELSGLWSMFIEDRPMNLRKIAEQARAGDPSAQLIHGLAQSWQYGPQGLNSKAMGWIRRSAESGYGPAQFQLGIRYLLEESRDARETGEMWLTRAAEQGIGLAELYLGRYQQSRHDARAAEVVDALTWYTKAAEQGCPARELFLSHRD